ncbi:hypothetical protein PHYSODRAFT_338095 [Phytophthora sojae]|uniref:Uncharacterized protein n=1 Tax=Phytophthora sojae (strain P6497) TaxID=1094619 RepID=G5A0P6_PHYSP|nr:hypothetical protein PHYSODRAFT_338095 [Phytophthora sojae]EGZ11382.1 hypothetical protein PHYSODRAFT_338095 [Phytophthora sojae]|eukprot:XP_009534127.1 hypothetical protein PHYSODRAFT_338095 [Phytophthora sojae]
MCLLPVLVKLREELPPRLGVPAASSAAISAVQSVPVQTGRQLRDLAAERRWSVDFSAWQYLGTEMEVPRRRCPSARPEFCGATTREQRKTWRRRCRPAEIGWLRSALWRLQRSALQVEVLSSARGLVGSRPALDGTAVSTRRELSRANTGGQQDSRTAGQR